MTASTMTLSELRTRAEDLLDLETDSNDLTDTTILLAANQFLNDYQREEVQNFPERYRTTSAAITVDDTTGYTLSSLSPKAFSFNEGFQVYHTEITRGNQLFEVPKDSQYLGYYIEGGKIYLTTGSKSCYFLYFFPLTQYAITGTTPTFSTTTLPIEQGSEMIAELYVKSRYLIKSGDEAQAGLEARDTARFLMNEFFETNNKVRPI